VLFPIYVLIGEGLYFSFELQVSQLFSQSVLSWNRSKLGELISCTAVCEYIDDPIYTKIRKGTLLMLLTDFLSMTFLCVFIF
jgi:hypothetical protein